MRRVLQQYQNVYCISSPQPRCLPFICCAVRQLGCYLDVVADDVDDDDVLNEAGDGENDGGERVVFQIAWLKVSRLS